MGFFRKTEWTDAPVVAQNARQFAAGMGAAEIVPVVVNEINRLLPHGKGEAKTTLQAVQRRAAGPAMRATITHDVLTELFPDSSWVVVSPHQHPRNIVTAADGETTTITHNNSIGFKTQVDTTDQDGFLRDFASMHPGVVLTEIRGRDSSADLYVTDVQVGIPSTEVRSAVAPQMPAVTAVAVPGKLGANFIRRYHTFERIDPSSAHRILQNPSRLARFIDGSA